jgi:hypothetical protein
MHPRVRRDLALSLFRADHISGRQFHDSIPLAASPLFGNLTEWIARMRIIALLFAFVLAGCTGNRLNAETKPTAVVLRAPPMAATFAAIVMAAKAI